MPPTRTLHRLLSAGCASLLLAACTASGPDREEGGDGADDKAGGTAAPVTLSVGTDDVPGRPAADQIVEFARLVEEGSDGTLRIEPSWQAGGGGDDWDQRVARMVVDGELDLAMIPTRAWDTEGVTTLRALNAPFLITSDELLADVVTDDLADGLLAGLDEVDVTGLALLPEGLRHLFVFGDPPASVTDLGGKVVRAPESRTTFAVLEALGARPDDLAVPEDAFVDGIEDGSVVAAESSFLLAPGLPAGPTAIGNLVLYPKVNSLVANDDALDRLTEEQRTVLREAAQATRDWAIRTGPAESEAARSYCERGLGVAAPEIDRPALDAAVRPVYDELESDPVTADLIQQIAELAPDDAVAETLPRTCTSTTKDPGRPRQAQDDDPSVLNGTYRFEVTKDRLVRRGVSEEEAETEHGVNTMTLEDGEFTDAWANPSIDITCTGTYSVSGHRVTFRWVSGCYGDWSATYTEDGRTIRWSDVVALPPYNAPEDVLIEQATFTIPWTRVD